MWGGGNALERKQTEEDKPRFPLHNHDDNARDANADPVTSQNSNSDGTTQVNTPANRDFNRESRIESGLWGERDVGGPVDPNMAMEDYEQLRRELTNLSQARSKDSHSKSKDSPRHSHALSRTATGMSNLGRNNTTLDRRKTEDIVEGTGPEDEFPLEDFMRAGHFGKRTGERSAKKIGVLFKNLNVKGVGASSVTVRTLPEAILGTFGPDLYHLLCRFLPFLAFGNHGQLRTLINDFTGLVRDGEMMLVLGRPGAGCSTFLKSIANKRGSYAQVTGDVSYGGIPAAQQNKQYRGEVIYNPEDDVHFPELNVLQTFVFALLTKTKKRNEKSIPLIADALMKMFGIPHTKYTNVGNEFVRGISGGERKRVSIAETMATKSSVVCWDNSTRGLDASTALDFAKSLRIMTDVGDKATVTTLYQAGEGIYQQMDKVLVVDEGRCIYQGPAREAKQYFLDLGFDCPTGQTTADFLTACTDVIERRFRPGYEKSTPKTPEELEKAFRDSQAYQKVLQDVNSYEQEMKSSDFTDAKEFEKTVQEGKSNKTVSKKSPYTVSFFRQVLANTRREFWLLLGDTTTLYTKAFVILANGLVVGSLFYGESLDSSGAFSRGGAMFFSVLFLGWLQLTELMKAVTGRGVVSRQHDYAFYRPSTIAIARVLADIPILLPQVLVFSILMYFMCSLDVDASKFWIFTLFVYVNTIMLTALYRMFAALSPAIDDAVRFSGIALNLLIIYTGYVIPKPYLISKYIWFGWIYYINPISYSFEGVLTNEFADRPVPCAPSQLVPQGPNADPAHQGCTLAGSPTNARSVPGSEYLGAVFDYSRSNLWRNFGVVIAFTVLYVLVTIWANETFDFSMPGGGALVFKKSKQGKKRAKADAPTDEEKAGKLDDSSASSQSTPNQDKALQKISDSSSIFTWENVTYSVPYQGGQKQLLNNIDGYAKPGVMIALMGASGAGKTTLLNTLSQRQFMGVVGGDMLVDGRPLPSTFQRSAGFCEQMDVHDGSATIREALEFSAILRQDRATPKSEKLAYVDTVIDLLELNDIQDALILSLGVEQRKRLTIAVELAAKPQLLLFLDEPTSGLDSQSAYSIIRFLRKLKDAGQAIVCTIHQPSSVLIQQFDMILALNPGGNTFYFGPVGEQGSAVVKYFADRGFECPRDKNVAEFILEVAAKTRRRADGTKVDWNEEWRISDNARELKDQIQEMKAERAKLPEPDHGAEHVFAAPVITQTTQLTLRLLRQYWRQPSYWYGRLFTCVIVGIFNGFTFWQMGNTVQDFQNRMFSAFLIITIPPTVVNTVVPKFFTNMMIWQAREFPSRIYGWVAFVTAQIIGELPVSVVGAVLYWLLWYYPAGLPTDTSTAGYVFLMTLLFFLFTASWGQWITAFAPSFTVIANTLPFFFVMFSLFNGVVRFYSEIPVFWRYWMYYVNPSTYWIGGVLAATLQGIPVECDISETTTFSPPPGQTCREYAGSFADMAGGTLLPRSADSTSLCEYCQLSSGDQYLAQLNIDPSEKWRDFGIFLVFCVTNYMLVYFFIWSTKIKGWGFGMGYLFGFLGKVWEVTVHKPITMVAGAVKGKGKKGASD
ncbi:MAG: hypothetical protein M1831_003802 [Alyxoria varia]|nr:MAG: hypothetical protein M1831_003802 [Alyxoria varia]